MINQPHQCDGDEHRQEEQRQSATAEKYGVPFLGEIPLDVSVRTGGDLGKPIVLDNSGTPGGKAFAQIAENMAVQVSIANANNLNTMIIQ